MNIYIWRGGGEVGTHNHEYIYLEGGGGGEVGTHNHEYINLLVHCWPVWQAVCNG